MRNLHSVSLVINTYRVRSNTTIIRLINYITDQLDDGLKRGRNM